MNYVSILGALTKDVELTYTNSGTALGKFSIAYNDNYTSNEKKVEKTYFFNVIVFGRRAEVIYQYFKKGNRILIQGKLVQDRWEDSDGNKRTSYTIQLSDFDFIDRANK